MHTADLELKQLNGICAGAGVLLDQISPVIVARLQLLDEYTETIADCTRIADHARDVFRFYERHKPDQRFTELERRIVVIGSVFADIGKTGPLNATPEQQKLIVEMFAVEGVRDDQLPVADFFRAHFSDDANQRIARFAELGLNPQMPMRHFWNMHSDWTLDIVNGGGLPKEAIAAAATHHLLENINPQEIVAGDGRFSIDCGDNEGFDRAEKLVILLDKYDALMRRGHRTHVQAIDWLRDLLEKHPTFRSDLDFALLLDDVDAALGRHSQTGIPV